MNNGNRAMQLVTRDFCQAILALAPPHVAQSRVPVVTETTDPAMLRTLITGDGLLVWDGASDATIYGDARVNHAFRAWHDAEHLAGNCDFTLKGERATCERQITGLRNRFPRVPKFFESLLRAEITGQAEFFARTGAFPVDQTAFIMDYMKGNA